MNPANKHLIALLSIATLAFGVTSTPAAPQQTEISTLPTITIIGKRLTPQKKTMYALQEREQLINKVASKTNVKPATAVLGAL